MLEKLIGKRIIVVGTENHPRLKVKAHYCGTLETVSESELELSDWNDELSSSVTASWLNVTLDITPTERSKSVYIPREKIMHVHSLNEKLINKGEYDGSKWEKLKIGSYGI